MNEYYRERVRIPLTEDEKKGLTDEEIFKKEYGLYSNFRYIQYWRDKFKEIYGYDLQQHE